VWTNANDFGTSVSGTCVVKTQTAGNNSTFAASTAFVTSAVANIFTSSVTTAGISFNDNTTITLPNRSSAPTVGQIGYQIVGTFSNLGTVLTANQVITISSIALASGVWHLYGSCIISNSAADMKTRIGVATLGTATAATSSNSYYDIAFDERTTSFISTTTSSLSVVYQNNTLNNVTVNLNISCATNSATIVSPGALTKFIATRIA